MPDTILENPTLLLAVLAPLAGAILVMLTGKRPHLRESCSLVTAVLTFGLVVSLVAPVLGGTLLSGGRVSVIGTLLGAAFVTIMTSGLLLMRVGEFWILACLGLILLLAVLTDRLRQSVLRQKGMI